MHILLPLDSDVDRAMAAVETILSIPLAGDSVNVTILNVEEKMEVTDADGGRFSSKQWYDETDYPNAVVEAEQVLSESSIHVEKRRRHAKPAKGIIDVANEIQADLIVMAAGKRTPVGKVLFGSVAQAVLMSADIPVTIVPVE